MRTSIVIRSKNEERFIGPVLQRVLEQEFSEPYEVLVLDSESQDRTVEIVRGFPVRLETIPAGRFTFGSALNRGTSLARGEYVVFLSAHCVPCSRSWLRELTGPFANDPLVVATYGRQEPMKGINPLEERGLEQSYALRADNTVRASFSNANSAVRKSVWQNYPFDETIASGEDFLWAYSLPAPHSIRYVHSASVFHSHSLVLRYWRKRWYEEGLMVYYLTQVRGVPNPLADAPTERLSPHKWHTIGRVHETIRVLWRKREFAALVRYPFYALNRLYFYRKGQRDGVRLYRQGPSASCFDSRTQTRTRRSSDEVKLDR